MWLIKKKGHFKDKLMKLLIVFLLSSSNAGYFSKIAWIFSAAIKAQSVQRQQKCKIYLSFYGTCDK